MRKKGTKRAIRTDLEWLGLHELTNYAAVSDRTLRDWIHSPVNPLPAVRRNGKILIHRHVFDAWLREHPVKPDDQDKCAEAMIDDCDDSTNKDAVREVAKTGRKAVARTANARCTFDWAEGPERGRLACVVHKHGKHGTVVIASGTTLNEMMELGILTGQALKDALRAASIAADENGPGTFDLRRQVKSKGA